MKIDSKYKQIVLDLFVDLSSSAHLQVPSCMCGIYGNTAHIFIAVNQAIDIYGSISNTILLADQEIAKTSLRLPKSLIKRMKLYAIESEKSVTEIVIDACNEYLQKRKH
jgi:hypothetical protein